MNVANAALRQNANWFDQVARVCSIWNAAQNANCGLYFVNSPPKKVPRVQKPKTLTGCQNFTTLCPTDSNSNKMVPKPRTFKKFNRCEHPKP